MPRPGIKARLILGYLLLLAISHGVRWLRAPPAPVPPPEATLELRMVDGDRLLEPPVRIAYLDHPAPFPGAPVVLLLHGSPGHKRDFDGLIPTLRKRYRVIQPDLPGFGHSASDLPDYSIRAHAHYMRQLLDRLGVTRAHVVGFSMGGGVALNLYDLEPDAVASVTLFSSIGVQELELLGSYRLNHLIHGLQLAGFWTLAEALPHMGLLDGLFFDVAYARNFYDTDQRPL